MLVQPLKVGPEEAWDAITAKMGTSAVREITSSNSSNLTKVDSMQPIIISLLTKIDKSASVKTLTCLSNDR